MVGEKSPTIIPSYLFDGQIHILNYFRISEKAKEVWVWMGPTKGGLSVDHFTTHVFDQEWLGSGGWVGGRAC